MKEHVQQTGVRKYAGDDLIELQAEPLKALQGFFAEYGACVIKGIEVTAAGNSYNVSPGLVALAGVDADGVDTFKVVPFGGIEGVTLPLYLTLTHSVVTRAYGDGKVKPIAYDYRASASSVPPTVPFLEITPAGGRRFVDAVGLTHKLDQNGNGKDVTVTFAESSTRENISSGEKLSGLFGKIQKWLSSLKTVAFTGQATDITQDASHRFVTDAEKTGWDDKYTKALTYTRVEVEQKIASVVNSAPGTLDTLQELAAALGNDPNFATSITALIAGKANSVHNHTIANVTNLQGELNGRAKKNGDKAESFTANAFFASKREVSFNRPRCSGIEMLSACTENVEGSPGVWFSALSALSDYVGFQIATFGGFTEDLRFRKQTDSEGVWTPWRELWHSGNFNPDNFRKEIALHNVNNIDPNTVSVGLILTEHINAPTPTGSWYIQTLFYTNLGGSSCMQIATQYTNGNNMYIRNRYAKDKWSPWEQIAKTSEVQNKLALKANRADLKPVALTGSYNDLTDKPNPLQVICAGEFDVQGGQKIKEYGVFTVKANGVSFTITHNYGNTNYIVIVSGEHTTAVCGYRNATTFDIRRTDEKIANGTLSFVMYKI